MRGEREMGGGVRCPHQPIRGAWCVGAVIGVEQNGAGCPEEENVFTEHLENGRRANSSK